MKFIALLFVATMFSAVTQAQDKKAAVKAPEAAIAKDAVFTSFEATLADGKVRFTRKMVANGSGAATITYFILNKNPELINGGTPSPVQQLSKESFSAFFEKINGGQRLPQLIKFAQEKKLSFSEEEAWIKAIAYYNSLD